MTAGVPRVTAFVIRAAEPVAGPRLLTFCAGSGRQLERGGVPDPRVSSARCRQVSRSNTELRGLSWGYAAW